MSKLMTSNSLVFAALLFSIAVNGNAAGPLLLPEGVSTELVPDNATAISIKIEPWPLALPDTRKVVGEICWQLPCDENSSDWIKIYEN